MNRISKSLMTAVLLATAAPALGQATRTWVSGVGDDANPCSRTAPCKTFAGAISKTAAGGEINVLDPGGFGGVTITKSLTIDGLGPMASILAVGQNGIVINGAGIVVNLRNLVINGASSTIGNGIRIINASVVNIDNVTIENFGGTGTNGNGIIVETSAANTRVNIINSRVFNANNQGILVQPTGGNVILSIERTQVARTTNSAIALVRNVSAAIDQSSMTHSTTGAGLAVGESTVAANVSNSLIANNQIGIANGITSASTTRLYGNVITSNFANGIQNTSGTILSLGNNMIRGNNGNEVPTLTIGTQ